LVIRLSSARQVEQLVASLESASAVAREAAVARLIVIGERSVERLLVLLDKNPSPPAAAAALSALEAIADPRALDAILAATGREELAVAAIQAARSYLGGRQGPRALDRLTAIAVDETRAEAVRLAEIRALKGLGSSTLKPLVTRLTRDGNAAVRAAVRPGPMPPGRDAAEVLAAAADAEFPQAADGLREAIAAAAGEAPLATLLRIVERVRDRELAEPPATRPQWLAVRAAAHAALAKRESRLALYDLRESLVSAAGPLPLDFLSALSRIGDTSCLEAIAAAHKRHAGAPPDDWWRGRLADAFHEIARRHGVTRRHALMKKIAHRYGGELMAASAPRSPAKQ